MDIHGASNKIAKILKIFEGIAHWKVHVFNSAKNNIYFINFNREIGESKSINLSKKFRIA